jgi:hypothetical protein
MPLSGRHELMHLPKRFPVGTTFVIEGRATAADDKNNGNLRVFSRFVVLPGGRRIDLGGDSSGMPRARTRGARGRQGRTQRSPAVAKKIVAEGGTTLRRRR